MLLRYADSDRARVALYAAGRAARHVAPSRRPDLLGVVLPGPAKITSRKEATRLLARYGPLRVMATLLEAYPNRDTHRDLRTAIASAARQRLQAEASWRILQIAVEGSREERHAAFGRLGEWSPWLAGITDLIVDRLTDRTAG